MCGIAGIMEAGAGPGRPSMNAALVRRMLNVQHHRGPDGSGVWADGPVSLGNCRLAIIDLSEDGRQPMSDARGIVHVVQNGEIYNYQAIRAELVKAGYRFTSASDTEVIVHGYAHWGTRCFERLRGMFAIAVWNSQDQQLVLARDRFGVKPLYYRLERDAGGVRLLFASEITPLLAVQSEARRPNLSLIYDFLASGLLDHTQETFFDGVHKLAPAHFMTMNRDGRIHTQRYWDFEVNDDLNSTSVADDHAAAAEFNVRWRDTIAHHLISDVPIGACLSGGLDSSAVVATTAQLRRIPGTHTPATQQLQTFTSCFADPRFDERQYSTLAATATGAEAHHVFPTASGFLHDLPDLLRHQEEPFAGTGVYAQWCVMRNIHAQGLKVVLDGQGADELLLGYGKFYLFYLAALFRAHHVGRLLSESMQLAASSRYLRSLELRHGFRYFRGRGAPPAEEHLVASSLKAMFGMRDVSLGMRHRLGDRLKQDLTTFSLPVLLRYEDKNAMAFSIESRVPFVDHIFAEWAASLPVAQKLRGGWTKYVLRKGLMGIVPERILKRQDKMGFVTPEQDWMRGELAPQIELTFATAQFLPEWADLPRVRHAFSAYRHRPGFFTPAVFFRYFIVEHWARQFFTEEPWAKKLVSRGQSA